MRFTAALRLLVSMLFGLSALAIIPVSSVATAQEAPSIEIIAPVTGSVINSTDIVVQIDVNNFTVDCSQSGLPDQDNTGQILALVDGTSIAQLTNIYCTTTFIVPGNGLTAGEHQLAVALATNTHTPLMDTAQVVTIDYQPIQALPLPVANFTGDPGVALVSPADGDTVAPIFDVQVQPVNFSPDVALEGKTNVPGYGHYHVWVDTAEMSANLAGMVLMPGSNAFSLDLSAWGDGEHTIRIEPAQNDHSMYMPATAATFTVNVSADAASPAAATADDASAADSSSEAAVTIEMTDGITFSPSAVTIRKGQTITWVNNSAMPHTATDDPSKNPVADQHPEYSVLPEGADPWDSGILQPGESFSVTFDVEGEYTYFCLPHAASGMIGTITVEG